MVIIFYTYILIDFFVSDTSLVTKVVKGQFMTVKPTPNAGNLLIYK